MVKYIYSFYFCCTTILTVGYGDITPRNYVEVTIVTLVEIFGIIAFANFINEIGYSLTEIRNRSENVEKELMVIQKMKKWYRMDEDLSKRARIHIINNKALDSQLSPEEEKGVMMKLSEELRHEIE